MKVWVAEVTNTKTGYETWRMGLCSTINQCEIPERQQGKTDATVPR